MLNSFVQNVLERVLTDGVDTLQLTAAEVAVEQQFDFLLLTARGFQSLILKYPDQPEVEILAAKCQDEIMQLLGVDLGRYPEQKALLDKEKMTALEGVNQEKKRRRLEQKYHAQLRQLREKHQVQERINGVFKDLFYVEGYRSNMRTNFTAKLGEQWVEDDLDVLQKHAHESAKEFRIRKELNLHLKEYNAILQPYLQAKDQLEKEVDQRKQTLLDTLQLPDGRTVQKALDDIDREYQKQIENIHTKAKDLQDVYRFLPQADDSVQSVEDILAFVKANGAETEAHSQITSLLQEHHKTWQSSFDTLSLDTTTQEGKLALLEFVADQLGESLEQAQAKEATKLESERTQKQTKVMDTIQSKLNALEKERKTGLKKLKDDYKKDLQKADAFYDKEIAHRKKLLKCAEVNTIFTAVGSLLPELVDRIDKRHLDANTIAFFVHMRESADIIGKLTTAMNIITSALKAELKREGLTAHDPIKMNSFASKVVKRVLHQLTEQERNLLDNVGLSVHELFEAAVKHLHQTACVHVPDSVQGPVPKVSLLVCMPDEEVAPLEIEHKKDFLDAVEEFNASKGVGSKIKYFYHFYQAMVAENPELCLEDNPNPGYLFFRTLEDEVNGTYLKLIPILERTLEALLAEKTYPEHPRHLLENHLKQCQALRADHQSLDKQFGELLAAHNASRQAFKAKKVQWQTKHDDLTQVGQLISKQKRALREARQALSEAQQDAFVKHLPRDAKDKFTKPLNQLSERYQRSKTRAEKRHQDKLKKIAVWQKNKVENVMKSCEKEKHDFDERTKQMEIQLIKEAYISQKGGRFRDNLGAKFIKDENYYQKLAGTAKTQVDQQLSKLRDTRREQWQSVNQGYQERVSKIQKKHEKKIQDQKDALDKSLELLSEEYHKEVNTIEQGNEAFKAKIEQSISKDLKGYNDTIANLEDELKALEKRKAELSKETEDLKEALKDISRQYFGQVQDFQEKKQTIVDQAKKLSRGLCDLNAEQDPHLQSLQFMVGMVLDKAQILAMTTTVKDALMEEYDRVTMDFDSVVNRCVQERQVIEVTQTSDEKTRGQRAVDNAVAMGGRSVVNALVGNPLENAKLYAQQLQPTLKAEKQLQQHQHTVDAMVPAQSPVMKEEVVEALIHQRQKRPKQYRRPFLLRGLHTLTDGFTFMALALLKGTAYATIDKLKTHILRAESERYEDKFQRMFHSLTRIDDLGQRRDALRHIESAYNNLDGDVSVEIQERLTLEQLKSWLIEQLVPSETQTKPKRGFLPIKSSQRNLQFNDTVKAIVAISSPADLTGLLESREDLQRLSQQCQSLKLYQELTSNSRKPGDKMRL